MTRPTLTKVDPVTEDGWSDWITPNHAGYLMGCCDCGLIHEMEFGVTRQLTPAAPDGTWDAEPVEDASLRVMLRARRHPDMEPTEVGDTPADIVDDLLSLLGKDESGEMVPHPYAVRAAALIRQLTGEA